MRAEPYTPSLEVVKVAYRRRRPGSGYVLGVPNPDPDAEFDRFVSKARADALREAAKAARGMRDPVAPDCAEWGDWLDARADRIAETNTPNRIQTDPKSHPKEEMR